MSDTASASASSHPRRSFLSILRPAFWLGGNWKKEIASSGLPSKIQSLIRGVVSQSRLRRPEKYDVAEELIQHFQDGNRSGLAFDHLVEQFGDPGAAAVLIRRSKIRNRSLLFNVARTIPRAIVCFAVAYLILVWYFYRGSSNPKLDYTAEFNRSTIEASEEDKAWPLYQPLWVKFQMTGWQGKYVDMRRETIYLEDEQTGSSPRLTQPSDEQWPQTVAMLKQHQELLDAFRQAAERKTFGLEIQSDPRKYSDRNYKALFPFIEISELQSQMDGDQPEVLHGAVVSIWLPHVQAMGEAAKLLQLDARQAVVEGDVDRVILNFEATMGLANQTASNPTLVSGLAALAVYRIGLEQLEEVISQEPNFFSQAQLVRLQDKIEETDIKSWLSYKSDHVMVKDMVQRCYTDDGNGDGRMTAAGMKWLNSDFFGIVSGLSNNAPAKIPPVENAMVRIYKWAQQEWAGFVDSEFSKSAVAPTTIFTCASRKEVLARAEELFAKIEADQKLPFWKSRNSKPNGWKDFDNFLEQNPTKHLLLCTLVPPIQQIRAAFDEVDARKNGLLTALVMYRYHSRNKRWPKSNEDLVPEFLAEIPVDILTGKPLHFKIVDNRPFVYSVGMDYDDDGGVDAVDHNKPITRSYIRPGFKSDTFEGDWILWPQVQVESALSQ